MIEDELRRKLQVSVIIPTHNRAHLIARALRSALHECEEGDEVIVVDDGSTDKTDEIVAEFPKVNYLVSRHGGAGKARNLGIRNSRNPLVTFLDSDDEWLPHSLAPKRALLKAKPELVFCFSNFAGTVRDGSLHHDALSWWHKDKRAWDEILGPGVKFSSLADLPEGVKDVKVHIGRLERNEMTANYVAANTVLVRREKAGDALWFPEDLPTFEDWECFGRLSLKGECAYLDMESAIQHYHPGPRLTDADQLKCATSRIKSLRRVWGKDEDFLRVNRDSYERTVFEQKRLKARYLLVSGRRSEAMEEMAVPGEWPLLYRLAARIPGGISKGLVSATRRLKNAIRRGSKSVDGT